MHPGLIKLFELLAIIAIIVVPIVILVKTLKHPIVNRIVVILLNLLRLALAISILANLDTESKYFDENENLIFYMFLLGSFTTFMVLYGIGTHAFDDTREQIESTVLNPLDNGGYKIMTVVESVGDSPLTSFISALLWSLFCGAVAGVFFVIFAPLIVALFLNFFEIESKIADTAAGWPFSVALFLLIKSCINLIIKVIDFIKLLRYL